MPRRCQYYAKVVAGDWKEDSEAFIGAVITMHQYMLHRIVKLLVATYRVFRAYQDEEVHPAELLQLRSR